MEAEELRAIIRSSIHEEIGQFKVDAEKHYRHHLFLEEFMSWTSNIKSSFWKSFVATAVPAVLFILLVGFVAWIGAKVLASSVWEVFK